MEEENLDQTWQQLLPSINSNPTETESIDIEKRYWQKQSPTTQDKPVKRYLINLVKIVVACVGTFALVYIILSAPAYWTKAGYALAHWGKEKKTITIATPESNPATIKLSEVKNLSFNNPYATPEEEKKQTGSSLNLKDLQNNLMIIPKINIKVPVIWNSPPDEETMLKALQNGVVHYAGTALPGENRGPIFISGHSSYYWWDKGAYKTVFANLDQLVEGDEVALAYNDTIYIYKVFEKIVVTPEQVEVLKPINEPVLSLMTCVPVGTNLKRLIVKSRQISPTTEPAKKTPVSPPVLTPSDSLELLPNK